MITAVECELKRRLIDLDKNYERSCNVVLQYLQSGNVWDPLFGKDGDSQRMRIHENDITDICKILWHQGRIVAYTVTDIVNAQDSICFCSLTKWAEWVTCDPTIIDRRVLQPEQSGNDSLERTPERLENAVYNTKRNGHKQDADYLKSGAGLKK